MTKKIKTFKKLPLKLAMVSMLGLSLTACTQEESGALWGAVIGGLVGSAVAGDGDGETFAIAMGAAVGSEIGASHGRKLDAADEARRELAYQRALEEGRSGERYSWSNPDTGASGYFEPEPAYQNPYNQFCREYTQTVEIGGETQKAYGEACRQPDGSWKITK